MKCVSCNLENPPDAMRCDCGYDFISKKKLTSYSVKKTPVKAISKEPPVLDPRKVCFSNKEEKIRTYHAIDLKSPSGSGFLTITSKRIIYHSSSKSILGSNTFTSEMPLKSVEGISSLYGILFRKDYIIASIILALVSIYLSVSSIEKNLVYIIPIAIVAGLFIYFSKVNYFNICLYSKANSSPIDIGNYFRLNKKHFGLSFQTFETSETSNMLMEIGAILTDYNEYGEDYVVEKWKTNNIFNGNVNIGIMGNSAEKNTISMAQ